MEEEGRVQIVVDGMTGVGKSSLVDILSEELEMIPFKEVFRDRYDLLGKFFEDRKKWAFPMQISFLNTRFKQFKEASRQKQAIMDRSIYSDDIFARMYREQGYMSEEEYYVYKSLLNNMLDHITPPVLMVYLKLPLEEAVERIHRRGRKDEVKVEKAYWEKLHSFYEDNYQKYDASPLLAIDLTDIDFVNNSQDRAHIVELIEKAWKKHRKREAAVG